MTTFMKAKLYIQKYQKESNYYRNHHTKFKIDMTINEKTTVPDGRTDPNYRKASLLNTRKILFREGKNSRL